MNVQAQPGAADRDRTGTVLPPRDFKSLASANSATAACPGVKSVFILPLKFERVKGKSPPAAESFSCLSRKRYNYIFYFQTSPFFVTFLFIHICRGLTNTLDIFYNVFRNNCCNWNIPVAAIVSKEKTKREIGDLLA